MNVNQSSTSAAAHSWIQQTCSGNTWRITAFVLEMSRRLFLPLFPKLHCVTTTLLYALLVKMLTRVYRRMCPVPCKRYGTLCKALDHMQTLVPGPTRRPRLSPLKCWEATIHKLKSRRFLSFAVGCPWILLENFITSRKIDKQMICAVHYKGGQHGDGSYALLPCHHGDDLDCLNSGSIIHYRHTHNTLLGVWRWASFLTYTC